MGDAEPTKATAAEEKTGQMVVGTGGLRRLVKKPEIISGIVLLMVVVLLVFTLNIPSSKKTVCTDQIIKQANASLTTGNLTKSQAVLTSFEKNDTYKKDPSCLYLIAQYDLNNGDAASAQQTVDQLKSLVGNHYKFNVALDNGHASLARLQKGIEDLKNIDEPLGRIVQP